MGSFALDMRKWCEGAKDNMHKVVRETVGGVVRAVDARSPVGNRELWAINQVTMMNREMYQIFREDSGKKRVTAKTLNRKFPGLKPAGYVGGRFRANWQLGQDMQPQGQLYDRSPPATEYPSGAATVAKNLAVISPLAAGHVFYLVNNLPYAQRLETGWSSQQPEGIVARTVLEFQQYVDAAVASVKRS